MPANYYWAPGAGSDLLASTAGNWRTGPTTPYTTYTVAPDADDHLYFQANASNADCVIAIAAGAGGEGGGPSWSGSQFAGIHLLAAYEGTVELRRDVTVGTLDLAAPDAAIWQNDPATVSQGDAGTLTVTAALTWTAGTLNSGSVPGTVELAAAATGTANPNGGRVSIGSTLKLVGDVVTQAGSVMDFLNGTYNWTGGDGIEVNNHCSLDIKLDLTIPTLPPLLTTFGNTDLNKQTKLNIKPGGTAQIYSIFRQASDVAVREWKGDGFSVNNQGGAFFIKGYTKATLTGSELLTVPNYKTGGGQPQQVLLSYNQTLGDSNFEAGSAMEVSKNVSFSGGAVIVSSPTNGNGQVVQAGPFVLKVPPKENQYDSDKIAFIGGGTRISMDGDRANDIFNTLKIDGKVYWYSSTVFECGLSNTTDMRDRIETGFLVFKKVNQQQTDKFEIEVSWTGNLQQGANHRWEVVKHHEDSALDVVDVRVTCPQDPSYGMLPDLTDTLVRVQKP